MNKLSLTCILFFLIQTVCSAQKDRSLLYEISGKGLSQPSYLYGTFHLLCDKDLKISPLALEKLHQSGQVYLEIDMDDPKEMNSMFSNLYMKDKTLKEFVSEKDYEFLNTFFKDTLKTNLKQVEKMKPFVLTTMIYPKLLGCTPGSPEMVFVEKAKSEKKEILGLEKAADQFAVMDKSGPEKGAETLVKSVREYDNTKKEFTKLLDLYRQQDIDAIYKAMEDTPETKDQLEDLLFKRNANWIPIITTVIKEKPTFFAVGAGHLGGQKGVLALLRKQGYTVKSLKTK